MTRITAKSKIESAALTRFKRYGFHATGVDQILSDAGVSKGSFYHAFKSKEELGLTTLELAYRERVEALANGPHLEVEDPLERLLSFLDHCADTAPKLWCDGCLIANYANTLAGNNSTYRDKLMALEQSSEDQLVRTAFGPAMKQLRPEAPSARVLARQFMAVIQGAISSGQSHQDICRTQDTLRGFKELIVALK